MCYIRATTEASNEIVSLTGSEHFREPSLSFEIDSCLVNHKFMFLGGSINVNLSINNQFQISTRFLQGGNN